MSDFMRDVAREIVLAAHSLGVAVVAEGIEDSSTCCGI